MEEDGEAGQVHSNRRRPLLFDIACGGWAVGRRWGAVLFAAAPRCDTMIQNRNKITFAIRRPADVHTEPIFRSAGSGLSAAP